MAAELVLSSQLAPLAGALRLKLGDHRAADRALRLVGEVAPDERLALAFLIQLAELSHDSIARALSDNAVARDLVFCLGASELVAADLAAAGAGWLEIFAQAREMNADRWLESMHCGVPDAADRGAAAAAVSEFKRRHFVMIAIADLLRRIDVSDTARLMSALADECIRAACALAARLMGARAAQVGEFCVIAMGKLGAGELNLSSDIDLIYLHQQRDADKSPEAATRMGELVTEILAAGSFRVDLRLRPGGRNAELVTPIESALGFYQGLGQTWERAALLRARPVAGALGLGRRFLGELGHFIYRSYLDFDTLRQLRAMKRQIEAELRTPDLVDRNIKLGFGGIRELEFIVQSLTLIYGGRDRRLRIEATVPALHRLGELGYLPQERARRLADAYLFLRDVEHKLQVVAGRQTHTLPDDAVALRALAARMGFGKGRAALDRLMRRLRGVRELVATQFRETLAGGGGETSAAAVSPEAEAAWSTALEPRQSAPNLAALGFTGPEESARHLELLARGPAHALASPRRIELLEHLGPVLLDEIRHLPDPDLALMNLAAFIASVGARTSFLALLEQHPATRRVLLRLFASSRYLSSIFIRHPDMLDTLVRSDLARPRREPADLRAELAGLIGAADDFESRLDVLRTFRHQEFLRIAIADLAGNLELAEVERELTALAEVVLDEALALAEAEVAARFARPPGLRLCVLAMGGFGAGEMTYNSDLDLIFVFDDGAGADARSHEIAARIAQKLIAILELRTREGYAYKLDLRLRPSGKAGPLVTSLAGFRDYHRQSSAVWERQALVRARVVAGNGALAREVEAAREEFVFARALDIAGVAEIAAMRARMEHEIGAEDRTRLNVKQGRGGLVDIEFLTQMMALRHGAAHAELRVRSTRGLLAALGHAGLLEADDARALEEGFDFLVRLENRLRIESDRPASAVPTNPAALMPLARRMGFESADGPARLLAELERRRARIRAIFERCFAAEQRAGATPAPA
jgi:[glutamine synthetase] adenylyltransferase / [glutamine synthetase]-adenylyl-L-tyrosine phosphorylase